MSLPKWLISVTGLSKAIAMILFIAFPFVGFYFGTQYQKMITSLVVPIDKNSPHLQVVIPTATPKSDLSKEDKTKNELLRSKKIEEVVRGIAMGHIPKNFGVTRGSESYNLPFYTIELNESQYQQLNNYFGISFFPSESALTLNNTDWKAFSYTEASDIYTKKGYGCILVRPNRFNTPSNFSCAKVSDLKNNSLADVASFMCQTFSEAKIQFDQGCQLTTVNIDIPLPQYSKSVLYFAKNVKGDEQEVASVSKEVESSATDLQANLWKAVVEDYTETEKKWSPDTLVSQRVISTNDYFKCIYTITIANFGKRQMIDCAYTTAALLEKQEEIDKLISKPDLTTSEPANN